MNIKKEILNRFALLYSAIFVVGIVAFAMVLFYMFIAKGYYQSKSETIDIKDKKALRGDILDVNGRVICTDAVVYEIRMDPLTEYIQKNYTDAEFKVKIDSLSILLADLFKDYPKEYYSKIILDAKSTGERHVLIHKNVNSAQYDILKTFPLFKLSQFKGGMIEHIKKERKHFDDSLARRTIGIEPEPNKYKGIEFLMNGDLAGTDGKNNSQKLANGYWRVLETIVEPENGKDVTTTIDINMQSIVNDILEEQLIELNAEFGVAILMEVETGEIRAMVNLVNQGDSTYRESYNNAVATDYEPGSVMKLASFMLAFEKDPNLTLEKMINTGNGYWQVTKKVPIIDYNYKSNGTGGFGRISVRRVFELSSNVGTAKIAYYTFENDKEDFLLRLSELGFDKKMDFGLEDESKPYFTTMQSPKFSDASIPQISTGYEIFVSPMHVLTLYNAIANNGKMVKPIFVKNIKKSGQIIKQFSTKVINPSICSKETLEKCQILLEGVVKNGTGQSTVYSDLVNIAGKSGTAQININRKYSNVFYNTTFVGYFPAEKPKYTCLVWINRPTKHKSGGAAAGPVLKQIAEQIYTFDYDLHQDNFVVNNMPKVNSMPKIAAGFSAFVKYALINVDIGYTATKSSWVIPQIGTEKVSFQPILLTAGIMPDVKEMNARDAVYILDNFKLDVKIKGVGKVVSQSIAPGTEIANNQTVTIELN